LTVSDEVAVYVVIKVLPEGLDIVPDIAVNS